MLSTVDSVYLMAIWIIYKKVCSAMTSLYYILEYANTSKVHKLLVVWVIKLIKYWNYGNMKNESGSKSSYKEKGHCMQSDF